MDAKDLLERLVAVDDPKERRALLKQHGPLNTDFFRTLKQRVMDLVRKDLQEALRIAEIGTGAADFAAEQEGVAITWWTRGNALLFLGRYDDCLADYALAISIFANLGRSDDVAQIQSNAMLPLMWTGRYAEARTMGQSALASFSGESETREKANLLLNLSICSLHQSEHPHALEQVNQAGAIFERLNEPVQAARCWVTQAIVLEGMDRFAEARAALLNAIKIFSDHDAPVPWARAALNLGILQARLADHQDALVWLEKSRAAFLEAGIDVDAAVVDLYRAQCFVDVGLLPEAETLGNELVITFEQLEMPRQVARAATLLVEVHAQRGQIERARQETERARQIFLDQDAPVEVAQLDLWRAALLRQAYQPGQALRIASQAADQLDVNQYPLRHAEAHLMIAACCEDLGRIEEAQVAYRVAWTSGSHPTGSTEPPPMLAYRIAHARGAIAEAAGDKALAWGEYGRAVDYLIRVTQGLGLDELRGSYLTGKRAVYEDALRLALDDGRLADAFRISELARAGTLRDILTARRPLPLSEAESESLEDLKARWAWRASRLHRPIDLAAEADEEVVAPVDRPALLQELSDLERELAEAYRRRRLADPRFAVLEQGDVVTLDEVQQQLDPETALLAFDHIGDDLLAFVIATDSADAVPLGSLTTLRWEMAGLGHALEEVRLFTNPADLAMLEADLLRDLKSLYRDVLAEPLARLASSVRRLLVVPCDVLHTLPLGALHDDDQHVLERYALTYLPSASLMGVLPERGAAGAPLIVANSWAGRLPQVRMEAERVARALASGSTGSPSILIDESATSQALREAVPGAGLIHIAAHGAFRDDAPLFSALQLADGPLTVNEVYGLDLSNSALVTLSGCQTGVGQGFGGEMLGLTQAFFFAGAPTLVASRWRVADETTAQLMEAFYAGLSRGETVADALRAAQLGIQAQHPHAGYWAAFAVWGRGFIPIFGN